MTTSVHTDPARTSRRPGRAAVIAVVAAAAVRAVAINIAWWTFYGLAVELDTGSGRGAREAAGSALRTIGVGLGVSALAVLIAGVIFLPWLSRVRSRVAALSTARQRLGPGWAVGAWLTPIANYVLPWIVVVDVWRASAPDPASRPTPVHGWWLATVAARLAHLSGWVVLIVSATSNAPQAESMWTVAVLHTVGTLLTVASAGLLALTVIEVDRGIQELASRPVDAVAAGAANGRPSDPLVPGGVVGFYGRIFAALRRSGRTLLVLETVTAAAEAAFIVIVWPTRSAPGGAADPPPTGISGWAVVAVPMFLVIVAVFMAVRSASLVVILRQAVDRPVSVGEALRESARRAPRLLGWALLLTSAAVLIGWLTFLSGSLLVLVLVLIPTTVVLGVVLNLTLVGVVTVEGGHLGRCFGLLRGRIWSAVGRYLSVLPLLIVFSIPVNIVYDGVGNPVLRVVLLIVIAVPFYMFVSAFAAVVYADLRWHESGGRVHTPQLVDQMDDPEHRVPDAGPPSSVQGAPAPAGP